MSELRCAGTKLRDTPQHLAGALKVVSSEQLAAISMASSFRDELRGKIPQIETDGREDREEAPVMEPLPTAEDLAEFPLWPPEVFLDLILRKVAFSKQRLEKP